MDKLILMVENVIKEVKERTVPKEQDDAEENRFVNKKNSKPMNQIKKEDKERAYRLNLAHSDK